MGEEIDRLLREAEGMEDEGPNRRNVNHRSQVAVTRERKPALWVLTLVLAMALVLAGAGIFALSQRRGPIFLTPSNAGSSSAGTSTSIRPGVPTASIASGQPVPSPPPGSTPTPPGTSPTIAPPPTPTPPPTLPPVPVPPELLVSPTSISSLVCQPFIGSTASFTVANIGGGQMSWSASASGYTISPASGTLKAASNQTVTVSGIYQSGVVFIKTAEGNPSKQQIIINCIL